MLPIISLLELEQGISDKWDSETQDSARLDIISRLSIQWAFSEAGDIIYKLGDDKRKEAQEIIKKNQDNLNQNFEEYLKHVKPQIKISQKPKTNVSEILKIDDTEQYENALDYFMKTTSFSLSNRNTHLKELKKLKTENQRFNYLKTKWFWSENNQKIKASIVVSSDFRVKESNSGLRKDDYYGNKTEWDTHMSKIIKKPKIIWTVNVEEKKIREAQKREERERSIKENIKKQETKSKKISKSPKTKEPRKAQNFLSSLHNNRLEDIVLKWYHQWKSLKKPALKIESFMFFWISFNALYYASTEASSDEKSWREFIENEEVKKVWESIKNHQVFRDFLDYLKRREIFDKSWNPVQIGWIYNMKGDTLYWNWDFWDSIEGYIWVIYQIRNNLFHGWKTWDDSDTKLIEAANKSFFIFLEKLYWFSE